jgi:sulfopyruvate decarboxylase TPP-binding subunit
LRPRQRPPRRLRLDNPLSHILRALAEGHFEIRITLATREEEAFGIAAGLYLSSARPAVMLQSSGLGTLNAIGSLLPYEIPVLMPSACAAKREWNAVQRPRGAARPILDAFDLSHVVVRCASA